MKLTSTAFENNGKIPAKYTCDGQNISPPLAIVEDHILAKSALMGRYERQS